MLDYLLEFSTAKPNAAPKLSTTPTEDTVTFVEKIPTPQQPTASDEEDGDRAKLAMFLLSVNCDFV